MRLRRWGRIINVASINSKVPSLHGAAYTASKHGLLGLTKTLALELAKEGITVNAICPGPVHTVMNDRRIEYDARRRGVSFDDIERAMTRSAADSSRRTSPHRGLPRQRRGPHGHRPGLQRRRRRADGVLNHRARFLCIFTTGFRACPVGNWGCRLVRGA